MNEEFNNILRKRRSVFPVQFNGEIVYNLLFEPKSTTHTGDTKSALTVNKQNLI